MSKQSPNFITKEVEYGPFQVKISQIGPTMGPEEIQTTVVLRNYDAKHLAELLSHQHVRVTLRWDETVREEEESA